MVVEIFWRWSWSHLSTSRIKMWHFSVQPNWETSCWPAWESGGWARLVVNHLQDVADHLQDVGGGADSRGSWWRWWTWLKNCCSDDALQVHAGGCGEAAIRLRPALVFQVPLPPTKQTIEDVLIIKSSSVSSLRLENCRAAMPTSSLRSWRTPWKPSSSLSFPKYSHCALINRHHLPR